MPVHEELHSLDNREVIESLVTLLKIHIPSDWKQLVQKYRALGSVSQAPAMVWNIDNATRLWRPPSGTIQLFEQLRKNMYQPGRGAWLSMDLVLKFPTTVDISYFWDDDAGWDIQRPGSAAFREELEIYHRSAEYIPEWFQAGLQQDDNPPIGSR